MGLWSERAEKRIRHRARRNGEKSFVRSEKKRNRKKKPHRFSSFSPSSDSHSSAALSAAAPARRVGKYHFLHLRTERGYEFEAERRKERDSRFSLFSLLSFRGQKLFQLKKPQNPRPSPLLLLLLLSPASRASALPVRAFKESSGAPSSKSKSKQGGLRALKSIELPKIDLLSKIELPPLELEEMIKLPTADDVTSLATETASKVSSAWDASEEKPAVVALGAASFVVLVSLSAVADAVDSVPILSTFFELVGLGSSGWLAFRHLAFGPDREALKGKIEGYWSRIFP